MERKKDKNFYITTAIDYVNSTPHIGTAYEKIGADVLARWHRLMGYDVHFQMGNDEHSINVWKAARKKGMTPKDYCDSMREKFEDVWRRLDISYDGFIQTSDEHHENGVRRLFSEILKNGDIYKSKYEGWYCESCEAYLTDKDLEDGLCPTHRNKPKWLSEENYFFALSKYREKLIKHIKDNPSFIMPESRRNEILSFLNEGLQDVSVSRSSFDWGVTLPNDSKHIVYVWFDALINYITAVGYGRDEKSFSKWWPADMHIIGKDITRFHCVIWPAMLMSAKIPLPKIVFGHGFVYLKGEKMSKTLGNVVTPMDVIDAYGSDALRYYLMKEGGFGRDGDFTWEHFIERYNGDLANGLGNLVSRTMGMAKKYQDGKIIPPERRGNAPLFSKIASLSKEVERALSLEGGDIAFHNALASIWEVISAADKHINENKPWEMAKVGKADEINETLWNIAAAIRVICVVLSPFMPKTAESIWNGMGFVASKDFKSVSIDDADFEMNDFDFEISISSGKNLFPRIDDKPNTNVSKAKDSNKKTKRKGDENMDDFLIDINDFAKIDLRIAEIVEAERVEGADKLLRLIIDIGGKKRQIVAGVAQHYTPDEIIGKKITVVANLKPAKIRGVESNGMLLAASDESGLAILTPMKDIASGARVK